MMRRHKKTEEPLPQEPLDARGHSLVDVAVEAWRMDQTIERVLPRMDPMDAARFESQYRWFRKKLDAALAEAKLRVVDLTGQPYSVGMAASPLNLDAYPGEELMVAQMIEPIILSNGNVVRTGSMLLGPEAGK